MKIYLLLLLTGMGMLSCTPASEKLSLRSDEAATTIYAGERPVLRYVHAETMPPEGVDPVFKRAAYIHPLWSPGGEILTRIQPPDHYHHYGIWNPWTKTRFGDHHVDFWNLGLGQGTVRFAGYTDKFEKHNRAGFRVRHEHIFFLDDGTEQIAMNEEWQVTVRNTKEGAYMVDLVTRLNTPLETGIILEAYRYGGGLGFRATEKWGTDNATVLTSEGKSRSEADGTKARWVIVEGASSVPEGRSGILFLSHPQNRAHPEPMRMWPPESNNGKGNIFFEFCPIRHREWRLEPDTTYRLRYRMIVFDGKMEPERAEQYWKQFAQ